MNQLREALEKAFDGQPATEEPEEARGPEANSEEPVRASREEPAPEPKQPEPKPEHKSEPEVKEEPAPEAGAGEADDKPEKPDTSHAQAVKPPQSWRPAVREHWSKLPAEVQAEVTKREVEVNRALTQSANARRLEQEFYEVVSPYEGIIRSQNSTPMQAVANLMQTSARLHLGTPQQKAQVVVEVIRNFGIDIGMLDSMLAGQVPPPEEDKLARLLDQRLAPVQQFMQRVSTGLEQRQQKTQQEIAQEVEAFSQQEFFEDVREDMADILELAAKRGQNLTLQDAYTRALGMRPDLQSIIQQRQAAQAAQQNQQQVSRARRAASSVSGSPAPTTVPAGKDIRSDIANAWDSYVRN